MPDEQGNQDHPTSDTGTVDIGKTDDKPTSGIHIPGVRQGNQLAKDGGKEAGRFSQETTDADRPAGGSTSRDSTSISDDAPVDPESVSTPSA